MPVPSKQQVDDIVHRFTYHPPKEGQPEQYQELRTMAAQLADKMIRLCPVSREQSLALTHLEEAIFWANAGIARNT